MDKKPPLRNRAVECWSLGSTIRLAGLTTIVGYEGYRHLTYRASNIAGKTFRRSNLGNKVTADGDSEHIST